MLLSPVDSSSLLTLIKSKENGKFDMNSYHFIYALSFSIFGITAAILIAIAAMHEYQLSLDPDRKCQAVIAVFIFIFLHTSFVDDCWLFNEDPVVKWHPYGHGYRDQDDVYECYIYSTA